MGWVTVVMLKLERADTIATAAARHRENQQSALWRMDSWLSVFLSREAARPYSDYLPSVEGETARVSPLLAFSSDYIPLHFQLDAIGVTSPQLPSALPPSFAPPVASAELAARRAELERSSEYLDLEGVRAAVARAESPPPKTKADPAERSEFDARVSCTVAPAPGSAWVDGRSVDVGPLIPLWLSPKGQPDNPKLVLVRRVGIGEDNKFQGFFVNWPALHDRLLDETRDLLEGAELVPVLPQRAETEADPARQYLANVPAALIALAPPPPTPPALTPATTTLGLAWLLALVASLAVGITLYKSVELGERRRRFVSAVTHELRTPLTTFKLYSEMLAGGFVPGDKRQQYLETLKDESERLSAMVENVLAHARLEQRGGTRRLEPLTVEALLARVTPPLLRQAEASGFTLNVRCEPPGDSPVEVDAASIGQVLRNLVDNAGKYGRNGAGSTVDLSVQLRDGSLVIRVRDHGAGVPDHQAKSIFDPFDRGDRDPTDPSPGIGLGLSISRGLARDMRGDVTLESSSGQGACFRLEVPASS